MLYIIYSRLHREQKLFIMNFKHIVVVLFLMASSSIIAQNSIDKAMISITENNKTINAARQYVTAKKLEYHTGLTPQNPYMSADYLIGTTELAGNQFDFSLIQNLDFPSVYFKKGNLVDEQNKLLDISIDELRQNILLEAKTTIIEIIHLNGQKETLQDRLEKAQKLVDTYQLKFDADQINGLELNKAKIQLLNTKADLRSIDSQIKMKTDHLAELNGGNSITITETNYFLEEEVPEFEALEDTIEYYDPSLKLLYQQNQISQSQLELTRAMTLPNFEVGYRYQSVLGATFNGAHFGLNIPLWEHRNEIKTERARAELSKIEVDEHENEHYYEIKEMYEDYKNLKVELKDYQEVLDELNSFEILNKLLEFGDIDFITYSMEINYYYDAYDQLKHVERDYHLAVAKLYKYQL